VGMLLDILGVPKSMIEFVKDRPGHDIRYSLDSSKVKDDTGWAPEVDFKKGLKSTVDWYRQHRSWLFSKYSDIARLYHTER